MSAVHSPSIGAEMRTSNEIPLRSIAHGIRPLLTGRVAVDTRTDGRGTDGRRCRAAEITPSRSGAWARTGAASHRRPAVRRMDTVADVPSEARSAIARNP